MAAVRRGALDYVTCLRVVGGVDPGVDSGVDFVVGVGCGSGAGA